MLKTSRYVNKNQLEKKFARKLANILRAAVEKKGLASLVVSGGSTPVGLFKELSKIALPWEHIVVSLADERWVDPSDDASNEKLVKTHLLQNCAVDARYVSLKPATAATVGDAIRHASTEMSSVLPFDAVILGMGEDGHTASIFPCSKEWADAVRCDTDEFYIEVNPTTAPHTRVSLRLPSITGAKHVFLHITGEKKRDVLNAALEAEHALPIKQVIDQAEVELVWAP